MITRYWRNLQHQLPQKIKIKSDKKKVDSSHTILKGDINKENKQRTMENEVEFTDLESQTLFFNLLALDMDRKYRVKTKL